MDPKVTIKEGQLEGSIVNRTGGHKYYSFKGIPYAHVPRRFAAPSPPLPWEGVREAKVHGPNCPQYNMLIEKYIPGNENCLFINVYTNSLRRKLKMPVMVFIHGGSYMFGSGDTDGAFGPEFLLQHDVVIVTFNYRLEVLGFLNLDTPEVPGNAGMKDQVAALKWVKENIANFGGNPNKVTLFGESSGSSAVTLHLQSPMSRGLFHKAIAQSGVSISEWAVGRDGKERALRAAKFLGNDEKNIPKVLEFLENVPSADLARLTYETMTEDEKHRGLPVHFSPVVEKKFDNVEAFITEDPLKSLTDGKLNKVPLMIGYNSDEALLMLDDAFSKLNFTNENLKYLVPREISQKNTEVKDKELGSQIKDFYVGNKDFTKEDAKAISDMLSDRYFVYSTHRFAHFYSKISETYLYKFSCDTDLNVVKKDIGYSHMKGASHADELFYLFSNNWNAEAYNNNRNLQELVYRLTKLWADFAKKSDPTPHTNNNDKWRPYTESERSYYDLTNEGFKAGIDAEKARVDFWDKMFCDTGVSCIAKDNL
ncbi:hypothetical protein O0L34_g16412 [Tuta absoluta]|nr:hypothetical protein O0L34_g16412 [Tuta absoluta]